jgi:hypothetical protein
VFLETAESGRTRSRHTVDSAAGRWEVEEERRCDGQGAMIRRMRERARSVDGLDLSTSSDTHRNSQWPPDTRKRSLKLLGEGFSVSLSFLEFAKHRRLALPPSAPSFLAVRTSATNPSRLSQTGSLSLRSRTAVKSIDSQLFYQLAPQ